ncbi:dodecin family protein [Flavobacterium sp. W20_MBD1_R3]|uniref:dodecin family protein n=1 Tax=Flavobacterium sp. W20_MBD1_R3 TaxID=3240278 RepID=UPI003F93CA62
MSTLKVIEILCSSEISWEDATRKGVAKASQSIKHIRSVYVHEQSAKVSDGSITEFRVNLKLTFELE